MEKAYLLLLDGSDIRAIAQSDLDMAPSQFGAAALSARVSGKMSSFWERWKLRDYPPTFELRNFIRVASDPKNREDYPRYTYTLEKNTGTFCVYSFGVQQYVIRKAQYDAGLFALEHEEELCMLLSLNEDRKALQDDGRKALDMMLQDGKSADFLNGLLMRSPVVAIPRKNHFRPMVGRDSKLFYTMPIFSWLPQISLHGEVDMIEMHKSSVLSLRLIPREGVKGEKPELFFPRIHIWDDAAVLDWHFISTLYGPAELGDKLEKGLTLFQCWRVVQSLLQEDTQTVFIAAAVAGEIYHAALETLTPLPPFKAEKDIKKAVDDLDDADSNMLDAISTVCGSDALANITIYRSVADIVSIVKQALEKREKEVLDVIRP